jgi:hypothetical protein
MNWLRKIYQALQERIGNRVTEREIRLWLDAHGFEGKSASLVEVALYAITPPGWKQVFRFSGQAKNSSGQLVPIFGIVEDDQRYGNSKITLYHNIKAQTLQLKEVSEGMIVRKH